MVIVHNQGYSEYRGKEPAFWFRLKAKFQGILQRQAQFSHKGKMEGPEVLTFCILKNSFPNPAGSLLWRTAAPCLVSSWWDGGSVRAGGDKGISEINLAVNN